jgi:hypothetical protein
LKLRVDSPEFVYHRTRAAKSGPALTGINAEAQPPLY